MLGFGLLCLNLSAATSYKITAKEAGSSSFKIFSNSLKTFLGGPRTGIELTVTRSDNSVISKWLSFDNADANSIITAGVTFQEGDSISFERWFGMKYDIKEVAAGNNGYGVDSYFQLPNIDNKGSLDFGFVNNSPTGGDSPSAGGPLPGVWATLLLGGGVAWGLKRRQKKHTA